MSYSISNAYHKRGVGYLVCDERSLAISSDEMGVGSFWGLIFSLYLLEAAVVWGNTVEIMNAARERLV